MTTNSETKKIVGLLATTALASGIFAIAPGGDSLANKLMESVLGGISVNVASGFLDKLKYNRLREWFIKTQPDDLNHDLQKSIHDVILKAIHNVEMLYTSLLTDVKKKNFRNLIKQLMKEIDEGFPQKQDEKVTKTGLNTLLYDDANRAVNLLMSMLPEELSAFDQLNPAVPFSNFFEENILSQFRLCFGEILKDEDHDRVWIAFQRFLFEDIKEKADKILKQQEQMHHDIREIKNSKNKLPKLSNKQLAELKTLSEKLRKPITLKAELTKALEDFTGNMKTDIQQMLQHQAEHYGLSKNHFELTQKHFAVTTQINERVNVFGDKLDKRFTRTQVVAIGTVIIALTGLIVLMVYRYYTQPFNVELILVPDPNQSIAGDYPPLSHEAKVSLMLQHRLTENITADAKAIFPEIKSRYRSERVAIQLSDELWQIASDTIVLNKGTNRILIIPNNKWARLTGDIRYSNGTPIREKAEIHLGNDTVFYSRSDGSFDIQLPVRMRKEMYDMNIYVSGRFFANEKAYPVGFIKIRKSE